MPKRLFASGFDSSNQLEVFVASFVAEIWAERSAENLVVAMSPVVEEIGALLEDAVTMAVFRRRFIRLPSSSVEVYPDSSESEAGGGVAARFRIFFVPRFLKRGCVVEGVSKAVSMAVDVCV